MRNPQIWLALIVVSLGATIARADALTGEWAITVTTDDGGKSYVDVITFNPTTMTSRELKKKGFDATAYESDTRGKQTIVFTCAMKSDKSGQAQWTGTASAGQMQGTLVLTKADGSAVNYGFKGERVKK